VGAGVCAGAGSDAHAASVAITVAANTNPIIARRAIPAANSITSTDCLLLAFD
jgi:hypothetical protein